jgi:cytochrome c-type biogenesis protein CcmH/NrfF
MRALPKFLSGVLACGIALCSIGASGIAGRYVALSHQFMCTCGCAQLLGECNHVGCPNSPGMLASLHTDLAGGMSDHAVMVAFQQTYGPESLASPRLTRFNEAAWAVPPAVLILGLLGALLLLRRWKEAHRPVQAGTRRPMTPRETETIARIRRETGEL